MPEERTIQFTCPVCKSGWGAKASMAGKHKTCPKCKTDIIVPMPSAGSAAPLSAPLSAPTSKGNAAAAEKNHKPIPLFVWVGVPAALVVAIVVGLLIAKSNRNAAPVAVPAVNEAPAKKNEPPADDSKCMKSVENYLKANENKYTITKTYPTEPVAGAYYHVGGKDDGTWIPLDRPPVLSEELSSAAAPSATAKELEKLQKKPLDKMTLDDLLKIETEELKKLQPDDLKKIGAELPKSAKPEDVKKMQEEALQKTKEDEKQYERIRAGRALRVEYDADEGFGRIKHRDLVFVIDADGNVVHRLNIEDFRLGKPLEK